MSVAQYLFNTTDHVGKYLYISNTYVFVRARARVCVCVCVVSLSLIVNTHSDGGYDEFSI